jgi:S-sulfosulfanyl-L-cysteine sulfohydrolase
MKNNLTKLFLALFVFAVTLTSVEAKDGKLTLIHMGDIHGHLIPRINMRKDDPTFGIKVGGLAYVYDQIKKIRKEHPNNLLVNTGDTIHGGAEVLYSYGQDIVDVLNDFGIDAFAPGNWDFVFGTRRYIELFAGLNGAAPLTNWNAIVSNLYYATLYEFPATPYAAKAGTRVTKPYDVKVVDGVRVGIIGLTADRGPQAVSTMVMDGFFLTPGEDELRDIIPVLKNQENCDLIVLISERGLAGNLELVEHIPGIDVVLSSDMHEETYQVLESKNGVLLVEEGQDGTMLGQMDLVIKNKKIAKWNFKAHRISVKNNKPDAKVAAKIEKIRAKYVKGPDFHPHVNPMNGAVLRTPIDTTIGYTRKALHRANYADSKEMPAVVEGSSHDFLADAFRSACKSDVGVIRGFRYGTHVAPGAVKLEDIYHFIPIGPQVACGLMSGDQLRWQLERGAHGSLTKWVGAWGGGWIVAFSGVTYDLDPNNEYGRRISNLRINGELADMEKMYSVGGYWYMDDPGLINRAHALEIKVLKTRLGGIIDAPEVVAYYFQTLPNHTVDPELNRVNLLHPLPKRIGKNREIQPLKGVYRPDGE